jgi:rhomboid protease GluP
VTERRLNLMLLVLAAKRIPHTLHSSSRRPALLVPIVCEHAARHEISAFEAERSSRRLFGGAEPASGSLPIVVPVFFLLLIFWHGLRMRWFTFYLPSPPFPADPAAWPAAFGLDVYRVTVFQEWWRSLTALFLHADAEHLFSNVGFGLLFFWALTRRIGSGLGFAFAILAGVLGNACNALYKPAFVISLGFSTALFGAVGVVSGVCACDVIKKSFNRSDIRQILPPVAAGLAFLALFGGGGEERADYAAHVFGFCVGFILGGPAHMAETWSRGLAPRQRNIASGLIGLGTILITVATWGWALQPK